MLFLNLPLPGLDDASAKELKELFEGYADASEQSPVRGGVTSEGEAAAYALVWEWGNSRQTKEGPKTVLGINPDGETVWLSTQAPFGYIRIYEPEFVNMVFEELAKVDFKAAETGEEILQALKEASSRAGARVADIIKEAAPVDSGDLRDSIGAADPNDPELAVDEPELELGTANFGHVIREMLKKLRG
jgi:hypothetical protein